MNGSFTRKLRIWKYGSEPGRREAILKKNCRTIVCVIIVFTIFCFPSGNPFADEVAIQIEGTRTALEKWLETQRTISKEKRDLALKKEMLTERNELVRREIKSLREKISEAEESIAEADKKRAAMIEENDKLTQASVALHDTLNSLEESTKKLLQRLPDPIRERVKPLSQQIPDQPDQTKLTVAQRFQNVAGILNEVNKTNRDIFVTSELRTLPDGTSAEVTALYLGIGQAYYSGANGTIAGVGCATDEGWSWKSANEAAAQIAAVISILNNEQVASFVQLPVEIK